MNNKIDKILNESFPASDPPSWSAVTAGSTAMPIVTHNPATGLEIESYELSRDLDTIVERSHARFLTWRGTSYQEKSDHLEKLGGILRASSQTLGELIATEMGKPLQEAIDEVKKCASLCDHYSEEIPLYRYGRSIQWEGMSGQKKLSQLVYTPLGPILGIMPWNYPFWQVFRFAVPAIAAGNVVLVKHAHNVTGCALKIEQLFLDAGFPEDVFKALLIDHESTEKLVQMDLVKGVSMTGSTEVGKKIAALAAGSMKPTLFELGGSDPYLILSDADIDQAADDCVEQRMSNCGQSCIAAKRFIVDQTIIGDFTDAIVERCKKLVIGSPVDENTNLGPMARLDLREKLKVQVSTSIEKGAQLVWKGRGINAAGYYFSPIVLTDPPEDSPAYRDELFGPVCTIIPAADEVEACHIANATAFGLGAAIYSRNEDKAYQMATNQIDAGMVAINSKVQSDPRVPFGGIGDSGYGRECGAEGYKAFCNEKIVTTTT
jgi:succinate-semialdehyde dehydrogenase/glutarate-semialdehyde dehydrogenase